MTTGICFLLFFLCSLLWCSMASAYASIMGCVSMQMAHERKLAMHQARVHVLGRRHRVQILPRNRLHVPGRKSAEVAAIVGTGMEHGAVARRLRVRRQSRQSAQQRSCHSNVQIASAVHDGGGVHVGPHIRNAARNELICIRNIQSRYAAHHRHSHRNPSDSRTHIFRAFTAGGSVAAWCAADATLSLLIPPITLELNKFNSLW